MNSVHVSASDPDVVVAGVGGGSASFSGLSGYFEGGVFTTADGGESWTRVGLATGDNRVSYPHLLPRPGQPDGLLTFGLASDPAENIGLFKSTIHSYEL